MLLAAVAIRHDRLEPSTIIGGNLDLDLLAHPATEVQPHAGPTLMICVYAQPTLHVSAAGRWWQKHTRQLAAK